MPNQMKLDNTEPPNIFASIVHEFGPNSVAYADLKEGDVSVQTEKGLVLVERKRPDDLIASIQDGRLFSQVTRCFAKTKLVVIAIDGDLAFQNGLYVSASGQSNFSQVSVAGALFRAQLLGAYVYFGGDRPFGSILRSALDLITTLPIRVRHDPVTPSLDPTTQAKIDWLAGLPSIGGGRAFALVKKYTRNTALFDIFCALLNSQLNNIPLDGIGKATVDQVRDFLGIPNGELAMRARVTKRAEWREFDSKSATKEK